MRLTEEQYQGLQARMRKAGPSGLVPVTHAEMKALRARPGLPSVPAHTAAPRSKYLAQPCVIEGKRFASKAEGRRYQELSLLQAAGEISALRLQTRWPLRLEGTLLCHYVSDFDFWRDGEHVIEDVKGGDSLPLFRLKSKLFAVLYHPLKITEIRNKSRGSHA